MTEPRCHVVDVDGQPVAVHGAGLLTEQSEAAITEIVRAARRKLADDYGPHLGVAQELVMAGLIASRYLPDGEVKDRLRAAIKAAREALLGREAS